MYIGRFDLPAIIGLLFKYCNSRDIEFMTIKQGTQYTACYLTKKGERYQKLVFKDCLRFTGRGITYDISYTSYESYDMNLF